jgi:hypothetical protein
MSNSAVQTPNQMTTEPTQGSGSHAAHARLAPSDSKRWTNCTASIAFCEANSHRLPKDTGSIYANLGTRAHDYAEAVLTGKTDISLVPDGDATHDKDYPGEDFRTPVKAYVDHCMGLLPEGVAPMVEISVPLFYDPNSWGTCDFAAVVPRLGGWEVYNRDYKHGEGVLVESIGNTQLAIYTLSLVRILDDVYGFSPDTPINLSAFQPRHREAEGQPAWELTLAELEDFCSDIDIKAIDVRTAADRVREKLPCGQRDISTGEILEAAPAAVFAPGDACRWCSGKAVCDARMNAAIEDMGFENLADQSEFLKYLPDLSKDQKGDTVEGRIDTVSKSLARERPLSDNDLVRIYGRNKAIRSFLDDVEEYLETLALEGRAPEGVKLVMGRAGNRDWADEDAADTFLTGQKLSADDRYTKKLISPTQAEKLLADKIKKVKRTATRFETLVTRSAPKKVLALADDKRPAVEAAVNMLGDLSAADDFDV